MRTIKFRAWNTNKEEMIFNPIANDIGKNQYISLNEVIERFANEGFILMQFTGLFDKNGVEIWEGDIIHYGYYEDDDGNDDLTRPMNFAVRWGKANDGWCANGRLVGDWEKEDYYGHEVIGNIFTNPELLEATK